MSALTLLQVRHCLAAHLGHAVAEVGEQARLVEDLQIDSLAMHAVLLDLEEAGGTLPAAGALDRVSTVGELHQALAR